MVQCYPELQRVYKGMAVDIGFVMLVKIRAFEHKACDLPVAELDIFQITAHANEECTSKDICGF
jgi:hypothetical protein